MANVKVFQIGFNKCGTRSMFQLFRRNGLAAMHWDKGEVGHALRYNVVTGHRPLEGHEDFVFYSDMMGPRGQPIFEGHLQYKALYAAYPDALFILNTRNIDNWVKSRMRHPDFVLRFNRSYGLEGNEAVEKLWREMWDAHHKEVRAFFADKPGQLLDFDIETQGPEVIADFVKEHYTLDPRHYDHIGKAPDKEDTAAA
ncbi:hypothetical protein RDV64_19445 [Acuticoccus sp. MNP-M23]|uniref:sulfotransferase n=1 Tax=Acuticoccus sp. MNP-M23 TaxID=3072793 RepID=UPI00281642D0|nr:sulfotransferase [Acuticoccus sp. MNP-M23]WMS42218.1 hypothetical protein RDV64_19445 [Acuticoccus sp. MNP-M23]